MNTHQRPKGTLALSLTDTSIILAPEVATRSLVPPSGEPVTLHYLQDCKGT